MDKEDIKKLCEERGIIYKADFMDGLSEKQFDEGCIKLYIRQMKRWLWRRNLGLDYAGR